MEIIRAKHSGFCFGVDRAINLAFTEAEKKDRKGRLLSCGHLIHNSAVVERLQSLGVTVIGSLEEASAGDTVIVRSHGEPREFYEEAEKRGIVLIDTTCVFVKKIHDIVNEAHSQGRPVIVIGDREHQEVKATTGWCGYKAAVIENVQEAAEYAATMKEDHDQSVPVIVCQTTIKAELMQDKFNAQMEREEIVKKLERW